ncbi:MAG TPA: toll/interleukin-1 receptor domain-containing protein [Bryobacteraceae bacterium]|nr:toll/interleukin-1 receptor domain-containing protein [Bryobacteraceae bacterium]
MPRVFISYRREDSASEAGRLSDFLREQFGDQDVFIDVEAIKGGDDFVAAIESAVGSCDVLVAVIGKIWASVRGADGKLRLEDANDFVRLEVAAALRRKIRVIPVLIDGAPVPKSTDLPPDLAELTRRNCLDIRELHFRQDAQTLVDAIAGKGHINGRKLLRQPLVWLAAGALIGGLGLVLWKRQMAPLPPRGPFRLQAQIHLNSQFGPVNQPPAMKLAHRLPTDNGVNLLEAATPLGNQQYEYESPVIMPLGGQRYLGLMHRLVDSAFQTKPDWTTVCFERNTDRNKREPVVRVSCEEGASCRISADDFGWAKACATQSGTAMRFFTLPSVYAKSEPASKAAAGWVAPSLETLRKRNAAYTEFFLRSAPLLALQAADRVNFDVHVNGAPIYIDGLPPETNSVKFDAKAVLEVQFGLENLNFSGMQASYEDIQVALAFMKSGQVVRRATVGMKYVALRQMPEGPVVGESGLRILWRAQYHTGRADDVYQIFTLSTRDLKVAQEAKSKIDAAKLQAGGLPLLAILRPPLGENRAYGIALGLRNPSGQVKFTFDDAASKSLCREVWKMAAHSRLIDKGIFRRSVDSKAKSQLCSTF